ncbi:MAG: Lrp/AsnC family transcriptional regulator [Candidatus Thiodiazotropha sp.]|nr:Lrp/AsnC family transcriptional regulator [Candidatus Thiodiazotropha sp.]MCM8885038.1 Lrp/AsnC family transcriptional regulator [Candidatus Thiodiazotropha sp.]MCM8921025.1 Lrp/AsnC family transcriptional regulator [Candidatus Thiodiazotropha sp.]
MVAQKESILDRPLNEIEKRLLNDFQDGFPLTTSPFQDIAEQLGSNEQIVMNTLEQLQSNGLISRVGPVFRPNRVGASTLAAMAVPMERLEAVAALVSGYGEVNHNYEREHDLNLWFVATAADREKLNSVISEIETRTGLEVIDLPMIEDFYINLGFPLQWS